MPLDKWPCVPDTFSSVLPGDLPFFLQTGATHALGRAVSIIDPYEGRRFDAIERFDSYERFCRCLRGGYRDQLVSTNWDAKCTECDMLVAEHLCAHSHEFQNALMPVTRYRCYMGLEEVATTISVGGLSVMVVSGQFRPSEGLSDVNTAISCLGVRSPQQYEVSQAMWESICRFNFPNELWMGAVVKEEEQIHLLCYAEELQMVAEGFEAELVQEAQRIEEIAQNYYDMAKGEVEARIMREISAAVSEATACKAENLWDSVSDALDVLMRELNVEYVAFFSGRAERDTVLTLKASAGSLPRVSEGASFPHFNWRKAGIRTQDERDTPTQVRDWTSVSLGDHELIDLGFRGGANPFPLSACLIPVRLPGGPFAALVIGPQLAGVNLVDYESFVMTACRDLATRVLTLQLAQILEQDRSDWENSSRLTGHRVRASIQSMQSQLNTVRAVQTGEPGFIAADRDTAEKDLQIAFQDLREISYAAESSVPGAFDVKIARRESVPLGDIVWDAVEAQRDLADENGIEIEVSEGISKLPPVYVNPTLMRFAFINLINNGLKYSYPRQKDRKRILRVQPPHRPFDPDEVGVEIVNFGLGIKQADRTRIFEWGVRLAKGASTFREVYGKGIGLWEVKHIIEGHGGRVSVSSVHHSREPVTDQNITQCITVFTVLLLADMRPHTVEGGRHAN